MTFPWQISIGALQIPVHLLLESAGIFTGFRYFLYLRNRHSDVISSQNRLWILIAAIFGSVMGSRVIGGLEDPAAMMRAQNIFLHFYFNKTILGGLLGGVAAVELVKKIIGEKNPSGDLFTYPLLLAMIIGRAGCFSMGVYEETYGVSSPLPWAMELGDGVPRHPVAIYEIIFLTALWVFIQQIEKKSPFAAGGKFKLFMIAYLLFRFTLDFIKPHYTLPLGLSVIQVTCVAGLVYYSNIIFKPRKLLAAYA